MAEGKPPNKWAALNDPLAVEEMRKDRNSEHWKTCDAFVRYYIGIKFPDLLAHLKEEVAQDILLLAFTRLDTFRAKSKFTTWLAKIAYHRVIDLWRRQQNNGPGERSIDDLPEGHESEIEKLIKVKPKTPEEIALLKELIEEIVISIEDFLQEHGKSERNREILQMVLIDGQSYEETALILNINAPVVGYVVREAQKYLEAQFPEQKRTSVKDK